MSNLQIFCVTNVSNNNLERLNLNLAGVGLNDFSKIYIDCKSGDNIHYKEKHYSELTFHYWFWKNQLQLFDKNSWIGFCQKRRFWLKEGNSYIKNIEDLNNNLLRSIPKEWEAYDALVCEPIKVSPLKKIKILKRGWRNLIKDPSIIFNEKKQNLKFQFDIFHGYGYLDLAVNKIKDQNKRESFRNYISTNNKFHPHIMVISKKRILHEWFSDLFEWLFDCEEIFGFDKLVGYDKSRLYAFLAERYLSFWFSNYHNVKSCPWAFFDTTK